MLTEVNNTTAKKLLKFQVDDDWELIFLIQPTWQIMPNYYPDLNASDFAIGCFDRLEEREAENCAIEDYLNGYKCLEELVFEGEESGFCCCN